MKTEHIKTSNQHPIIGNPDTVNIHGHFNYGCFNMGMNNKDLEPKSEDIDLQLKYNELSKDMNFRAWTDEEGDTIMVDDGYGTVTSLKRAWTYPLYSPMKTEAIKVALKMKVRQRLFRDTNWHRVTLPNSMET
jgi:hypothetical protein